MEFHFIEISKSSRTQQKGHLGGAVTPRGQFHNVHVISLACRGRASPWPTRLPKIGSPPQMSKKLKCGALTHLTELSPTRIIAAIPKATIKKQN